ncbi:MAG: hypothetical protein HYY84_06700 [Deltaproteobacteria bacterium]|nr:hypothetical protein [Deltaproteobacteria bacterium]
MVGTINGRYQRTGGYTLVLSMVILVTLTAIGIFALRTTRTDQLISQSQRIAALAHYIAEAGLIYVQRHASQGDANLIIRQINASDGGMTLTYPSTNIPSGVFGEDAGAGYAPLGYGSDLRPAFQVVVSKPRSIPIVAGQSIGVGSSGSKKCYWVFDYLSTGVALPSRVLDAGVNWSDPGATASDRFGVAQIRAEIVQMGNCF